jgi:mono/diheme cytochrome c family protein
MNSFLRIACLIAFLAACRESQPAPAGPTSPSAPAAPPRTAADQIARGGHLFAANCAKCHGDSGEGTDDAPPLVGKGALPLDPRPDQKRTAKFHTAMDVAQFATQQMPPKASDRAKLAPDDYWSILAFALNANGVAVKEPVGPGNAASIVLHP